MTPAVISIYRPACTNPLRVAETIKAKKYFLYCHLLESLCFDYIKPPFAIKQNIIWPAKDEPLNNALEDLIITHDEISLVSIGPPFLSTSWS